MLSKEHYEEYFDGYHIVDAVVRNRSHFYFVLKKIDSQQSDDDESLNRIVRVTLVDGDLDLAKSDLHGYDEDFIYCEITYPDEALLVVDSSSRYFHGKKRSQPAIPARYEGGPIGGAVKRVRPIGLSSAIVVTSSADLVIRHEDETWTRIGPEFADEHPAADTGFKDFDGFALDDIYAGGDAGLFHFDGTSWQKTSLPKRLVSAVCCSPDGFVYAATGMPGRVAIYKGRGETWEKLYEDIDKERYADQMRDLVWHDNMLWAARWNEMVILKDGKREYWRDGPSGGHLSVRDGVLLCAGHRSAYWRESGGAWRTLFEGWDWD